jgi:hypothetical protein
MTTACNYDRSYRRKKSLISESCEVFGNLHPHLPDTGYAVEPEDQHMYSSNPPGVRVRPKRGKGGHIRGA